MRLLLTVILTFAITSISFSQRAKEGDYTISTTGQVVNTYTYLTADAGPGIASGLSITVNSNNMSGGVFGGSLAPGDLILIYQVQGSEMDIFWNSEDDPITTTTPFFHYWTFDWLQYGEEWGRIDQNVFNYLNAGNFEYREVQSVSGGNTINLNCALQKNYTAAGHVQVIRIPRFNNLTIATGGELTATDWNGTTGGVAAVEVDGDLVVQSGGIIDVSARGFRGGVADNQGFVGGNSAHTQGDGNGATQLGSTLQGEGGRKGEGIGGYTTEYFAKYSSYGRGAPANGGGGGGFQNAGGGGGSNVGSTSFHNGRGVPNAAYTNYWNAEKAGFASEISSGGGRGGYSLAESTANLINDNANDSDWDGDARKENGGLGGHAIHYDANRIFMGGGGGAGDQDSDDAGDGGRGGGVVFILSYGTISGNGSIEANGQVGNNSNKSGSTSLNNFTQRGNDGAGGGGGGGYIYIENINAIPNTLSLIAEGGDGGDQDLWLGTFVSNEVAGPGGAGAGGGIAFSSGSPIQSVVGGSAGIALRNGSVNAMIDPFEVNGATDGGTGLSSLPTALFDILATNDTICLGEDATLSVSTVGTLPGTLEWYTQQFGGTPIAGQSGQLTYSVSPAVTTTYYVGVCPGSFRVPVTVVVGASPIISGTPVITDEDCVNLGSITGLTTSGGTLPYTFTWNGSASVDEDLIDASAGDYTLIVEDVNGCTDTSGIHTINSVGGPVIDETNLVIADENCGNGDGSITGITATGTGLTYSWDNGAGNALDASNLTAGTYTLTVTDVNNCTATSGPHTISNLGSPTIDETNLVITNELCNGTLGTITGITASGVGSLTYSWDNSVETTIDINNLSQGTYTLTVTDQSTMCTAQSGPHTVNFISGPSIDETNLTITDELCNGTLGTITGITATGSNLTYSWTNGGGNAVDASDLTADDYTLTVTDDNNCTATSGPHTVNFIAGPTVDETNLLINDENCGNGDGSITGITASGTGLTYSWTNGGGNTIDVSSLNGGNYTLTITDANNCTVTSGPHTVNNLGGPSIDQTNLIVANELCNGNLGSITGLTASGVGSLTYSWDNSAETTINLADLSQGSYTLTVTDQTTLCTATAGPFNVGFTAGPSIDETNLVIADELCNGTLGSITNIVASGSNLTYSWTNGGGNAVDASNLTAGDYTLTVTDDNLCTATSGPHTVNFIAGPTVDESNLVIADENCGNGDGAITGIAAGGTGLTYSWDNGGGNALNATSLSAGDYTLTVTDGNNCTVTSGPHTVNNLGAPVIDETNLSVTDELCNGTLGTISGITATGVGSLTYSWDNSAETTIDLVDLAQGSFTLTVTDQTTMCTATSGPYNVNFITGPSIDETNLSVTDELCNGTLGTITGLSATGSNLTYSWTNGGGNALSASDLSAGDYTLTVTDDNNCTATSGPHTVNYIAGPSIDDANVNIVDENCNGGDGEITGITATGNGLTYSWDNGAGNNLDATSLSAGSYTLTVTDVNICSVTSGPHIVNNLGAPTIDETNLLITDELCNGTLGTITGLTATGVGTLDYAWDNSPATTIDLNAVSAGSYTLTVTDQATGCSAQAGPFVVNFVPGPTIDETSLLINGENCSNNDGSITGISASGNDLSYSWNNGGGNNLNATNLVGGDYTLTVTDANGCTALSGPHTVTNLAAPVVDLTNLIVTDEFCNGTLGTISGMTASGIGNLTYSWDNSSETTIDLTNLSQGTYTLTVEDDATGCITTEGPFTVNYVGGPTANFTVNPSEPQLGEDVVFTDASTGNIVIWQWQLGDSASVEQNPIQSFNEDGQYEIVLTVIDDNGCVDSMITVIDIQSELTVPNVITANNDGTNDFFEVEGLQPNTEVVILDRWGLVVFESTNYNNDWGGIDQNGNELTEGVYTYLLITPSGERKHGFIHLLR